VAALLKGAGVVIAHNAAFDYPWWKAQYLLARERTWADSMRKIDWQRHGQDS